MDRYVVMWPSSPANVKCWFNNIQSYSSFNPLTCISTFNWELPSVSQVNTRITRPAAVVHHAVPQIRGSERTHICGLNTPLRADELMWKVKTGRRTHAQPIINTPIWPWLRPRFKQRERISLTYTHTEAVSAANEHQICSKHMLMLCIRSVCDLWRELSVTANELLQLYKHKNIPELCILHAFPISTYAEHNSVWKLYKLPVIPLLWLQCEGLSPDDSGHRYGRTFILQFLYVHHLRNCLECGLCQRRS